MMWIDIAEDVAENVMELKPAASKLNSPAV
jgi:hypothetical protein